MSCHMPSIIRSGLRWEGRRGRRAGGMRPRPNAMPKKGKREKEKGSPTYAAEPAPSMARERGRQGVVHAWHPPPPGGGRRGGRALNVVAVLFVSWLAWAALGSSASQQRQSGIPSHAVMAEGETDGAQSRSRRSQSWTARLPALSALALAISSVPWVPWGAGLDAGDVGTKRARYVGDEDRNAMPVPITTWSGSSLAARICMRR